MKEIKPFNAVNPIDLAQTLSWENAAADYSYSCFDYYSNYRSTVGYNWVLSGKKRVSEVEVYYTAQELGRKVSLQVVARVLPAMMSIVITWLQVPSTPDWLVKQL